MVNPIFTEGIFTISHMDISKTLLCLYSIVAVHPFVVGLYISRLTVEDQEKFAIFDDVHVQAVQGQNITLIGWYDNLEEPIYMFNGKSIRKSEKFRMEWSENQLILTITNLTDKQTGLYSYYHPSLKSIGHLYLYVKSKNFFAPSELNEIYCDDPKFCTLPCRLNNYEDKYYVMLYLDGKLQNRKYSSGVGFRINRQKLNTNITVANATCVLHNEKASYIINFLDKLPSDWLIGLKINTSWPKLGDSVSIMCSVIVNDSYSGSSINILLSLRHNGDAEFGSKCHIDSSKPSEIKHKSNVMVKEKEFSISSYTSYCRGKFTCQVRNSSGRYFNKQSSVHLDQLEIISRTDAEVETVVGAKMNVAAKFRSPSKEGQHLLFNMSRIWEKVTCQGITCVITNETTHVAFATDNTTIDYSYDVATQNSGWHHYSLGIYRSNELIQRLKWDIFVRGQVLLQHNCSRLLLVPALCVFTTISYTSDNTIMITTTEEGHKEILHPSSVNEMIFLTLKTYESFINTSVNIRFQNQHNNPILLTVSAVEFFYFVHRKFDNANSQDIYEGDNVTIKGRIALSNGSFLIQHRSDPSLCPSKSEKIPECTLSNFNTSSKQTFNLIWKNNIVASINIPATRKVNPPFNLKISTVYKSESFTLLTCPIGGSPIFYNWTVNEVLISGHSDQRLMVNTSELPGHYKCCAINRIGYKCYNLREENDETTWIIVVVTLSIVLSVVVFSFVVVLLRLRSKFQKIKIRAMRESGQEEIALVGTEEWHKAGTHVKDISRTPELRRRPNKNSTKVEDIKEIRQRFLTLIKPVADINLEQLIALHRVNANITACEKTNVNRMRNLKAYEAQIISEMDAMRDCCVQSAVFLKRNSTMSYTDPYLKYYEFLIEAGQHDTIATGRTYFNGLLEQKKAYQQEVEQLENSEIGTGKVKNLKDFQAMMNKLYDCYPLHGGDLEYKHKNEQKLAEQKLAKENAVYEPTITEIERKTKLLRPSAYGGKYGNHINDKLLSFFFTDFPYIRISEDFFEDRSVFDHSEVNFKKAIPL